MGKKVGGIAVDGDCAPSRNIGSDVPPQIKSFSVRMAQPTPCGRRKQNAIGTRQRFAQRSGYSVWLLVVFSRSCLEL